MADETPIPAADVAAALEDPTPTEALVTQHLLEAGGPFTAEEVAGELPTSRHGAYNVLTSLVEEGYAEVFDRETPTRGRNPKAYEATRALRSAAGADPEAHEPDDVRDEIVAFLAESHFRRFLSAQPCSRIALDIPGASSKRVAADLRRLRDDGVVERANGDTGSKSQWRLTDPSDVAPFRA